MVESHRQEVQAFRREKREALDKEESINLKRKQLEEQLKEVYQMDQVHFFHFFSLFYICLNLQNKLAQSLREERKELAHLREETTRAIKETRDKAHKLALQKEELKLREQQIEEGHLRLLEQRRTFADFQASQTQSLPSFPDNEEGSNLPQPTVSVSSSLALPLRERVDSSNARMERAVEPKKLMRKVQKTLSTVSSFSSSIEAHRSFLDALDREEEGKGSEL